VVVIEHELDGEPSRVFDDHHADMRGSEPQDRKIDRS